MYQLNSTEWQLVLHGETIINGKWTEQSISLDVPTEAGWKRIVQMQQNMMQRADYRHLKVGMRIKGANTLLVYTQSGMEEVMNNTWIREQDVEQLGCTLNMRWADDGQSITVFHVRP